MNLAERKVLRQQLRHARNALSENEQHSASHTMAQVASALPIVKQARNVALYLPNDGEISLNPLIRHLTQQKSNVFLPVLHPFTGKHLLFVRYDSSTPLRPNRFGIPEPVAEVPGICPLGELDVILMPLVGFDANCNRLGMGGGFYDRTLATLSRYEHAPRLIGTAHDCQEVPSLPIAPWDVPLDGVLTPARFLHRNC